MERFRNGRIDRRAALLCEADGRVSVHGDAVLEEAPLAISVNGQAYAVMMITPDHIEDFLVGFLFAEGLITQACEIHAWETAADPEGLAVYVQLAERASARVADRARRMPGASGCGLCGVPQWAGLMPPDVPHPPLQRLSVGRIHAWLSRMQAHQRLNHVTGTAHGAILVGAEACVVREDIGRHNAVDKVIGYALRHGWRREALQLLGVSSRLTFEIVHKAVRMAIPTVAAISGVSALALRVAEERGITLVAYAREGRLSGYTHPARIRTGSDNHRGPPSGHEPRHHSAGIEGREHPGREAHGQEEERDVEHEGDGGPALGR